MRASGGAQTTGEGKRSECKRRTVADWAAGGQRPDRDTEWCGISRERLSERPGEVKAEDVGRLVNRK